MRFFFVQKSSSFFFFFLIKKKEKKKGEKKKEILGYPCISFSAENDSSRITGFLAPSIRGLGEFEDYGMPLEMTMSSKTEKMVIETKAKSILIEPINKDLFFLTND